MAATRGQANSDRIAIRPGGGVVVVDAENWTGRVTIGGGTLRQNGYAREREVEGVGAAAVGGMGVGIGRALLSVGMLFVLLIVTLSVAASLTPRPPRDAVPRSG